MHSDNIMKANSFFFCLKEKQFALNTKRLLFQGVCLRSKRETQLTPQWTQELIEALNKPRTKKTQTRKSTAN